MNDHFRNHSDDWSQVPRQGALPPMQYDPMYQAVPASYGPPVLLQVRPQLSVGVAYLLWLLLGLIGAHYFYMGKIGVGVLWLLTGGLFGVGWFVDLFTLRGQVERVNQRGW